MKKAITISGGYDSGCLPFLVKNIDEYDFIFFKYQQIYLKYEKEKAEILAEKFNKTLQIIDVPKLKHDHARRNFIFISELKKMGYDEVIMGNRGVLPIFDKYKDSNFLYLKIIGFLFNIKIKLPIIGWNKKKILHFLKKRNYINFYNCYLANIDPTTCPCPNCIEMRKIKKEI